MSRYSTNLLATLKEKALSPIIVLEIDGVVNKIVSSPLFTNFVYGDEVDYGDEGLFYGELRLVENQLELISLKGSTTSITQNLDPDKARGSSVSSMKLSLVDKNGEATKLASGFYGGELLFRDVKVWVGYSLTADFNSDFVLVFRGIVENVVAGQGFVDLFLASPDQKRRQVLAPQGDTTLTAGITGASTIIPLASVENFLSYVNSPLYINGDTSTIKFYLKIDDELIQYTAISGNNFTGCVRGQLGTVAASHSIGAQVTSFIMIEGMALDLALKIMLSDASVTPYASGVSVGQVNYFSGGYRANSFFFPNIDLSREYNVRAHDFITTSGFDSPTNNFTGTWKEILEVIKIDGGTVVVVDFTLVDSLLTGGLATFVSRWNTLGGFGLGLKPEEVDIEKHLFVQDTFLLTSNLRFFIREEISEAKEFIETELYKPFGCYSLPSDTGGLSRLSVGIHQPPLPLEQIQVLSSANILNPDKISVKRSVTRYHYNSVIHKFEDTALDEELRRKKITVVGTPLIQSGNRTLVIESKGLKADLSGDVISQNAGVKLLERYRSAAEHIENIDVAFSVGALINIGDVVVFDPTGLNIINRESYDRNQDSKLLEVLNKTTDIKSGSVKLSLIDTSFDIESRYCLIGPSSKIGVVISQTQFLVEPLHSFSVYPDSEFTKWDNFVNMGVKIRNANFSSVFETQIVSIGGGSITIASAPPFTLTAGMILESSDYDDAVTGSDVKLVYGFLTDDENDFADGGKYYSFI